MALDKKNYIIPSVLLCEAYYNNRHDNKFIVSKVENVVQDGFFKSIEMSPLACADLRKKVAKAINIKGSKIESCVIWATERLGEHEVNLNALDEKQRQASVDAVKAVLDGAKETAATHVGIYAGPNVGILERSCAYKALIKSVGEIASYAKKLDLEVLLEPLDRFAHKKKLLGTSRDAKELFEIISKEHSNVKLCLDTAHTALNREDLCEALDMVAPFTKFVHLSNAVLDFNDPLYGDNHILPGEPGFLTVKAAERMFTHAYKAGVNADCGLRAAVEFRQNEISLNNRAFEYGTDFLKQILLEFYLNN
jgi:hydroxypyruvate isomerase